MVDILNTDEDSYMIYVNGDYLSFSNPIVEQEEESYQYYKYTPIKELVTIYSNEIIEDIPSDLANRDYYVTKTLWDLSSTGCLNGDDDCVDGGIDLDGDDIADRSYDYDYHF